MYLFFDTETTGLPKSRKITDPADVDNWPRVVQLAYSLYTPDGLLIEARSDIIRPEGFEVPDFVAAINNITTERAYAEGDDLTKVLKNFQLQIAKADLLICHNVPFDVPIVGAEYHRKMGKNPLAGKKTYCTQTNRAVVEYCDIPNKWGKPKWPRLMELHETLFDEGFEKAHDAGADTHALARCFFELQRLEVIKTGCSAVGICP